MMGLLQQNGQSGYHQQNAPVGCMLRRFLEAAHGKAYYAPIGGFCRAKLPVHLSRPLPGHGHHAFFQHAIARHLNRGHGLKRLFGARRLPVAKPRLECGRSHLHPLTPVQLRAAGGPGFFVSSPSAVFGSGLLELLLRPWRGLLMEAFATVMARIEALQPIRRTRRRYTGR